MQIKLKYYLITVAAMLIIGAAKHFYDRSQRNQIIEQVKETLENEKQLAIKQQDSIIKELDQNINNLILSNEQAKKESQYWYNQAKRKSVNPAYDIDFITAADIIARSKYKPGE